MRVVRDVGYIRRRRRGARLMVGLGILLLFSSWLVTLTFPDLFLLALVGLVLGFVLFNGGMQQIARWSRSPRNDEVIDSELQRLNDRYTLIHYPDVPGRRPDHILVAPNALLVITSREVHGRMAVTGRRWRLRRNPLFTMFTLGSPQLGNPTIENEEQVKAVRAYLGETIPVEPEGAIVFVAADVEVEINESPIPILHVTELYDYVREQGAEVTIGSRERDQIVDLLSRGEDIERVTSESGRPKKRVRAA